EYAPPRPNAERVSWEEAIERLKARLATSGNRATTLDYYLKLIRHVRDIALSPADVTPGIAAAWRDKVMGRPSRRGKPPSAHYVTSLLGGLSALWQKWVLDDLKIVSGNPWADVVPTKPDKLSVKYSTDEQNEQ